MIKNNHISGGQKVPIFRSYTWGNCKIDVRPTGIRRFLPLVPYFYGSDSTLKIHISNNSDNEVQFSYKWILERIYENKRLKVNEGTGNIKVNPRSKITEQLLAGYLSIPGYYILGIWELNENRRHMVANFTVLDRDIYLPAIIMSLCSGLVGALLVIFIQWLLSKLSGNG